MNLSQKKIWKSKVDKNEEIIWDRRFWLIVYIVSDNELLKLLVETSAKQQQISLEKQDSSSDILLRILEQTVEEETLLSIADTRRICTRGKSPRKSKKTQWFIGESTGPTKSRVRTNSKRKMNINLHFIFYFNCRIKACTYNFCLSMKIPMDWVHILCCWINHINFQQHIQCRRQAN